jgi:phospholipid/cholesterol/gamma-HCH transport system substrate-binding protein
MASANLAGGTQNLSQTVRKVDKALRNITMIVDSIRRSRALENTLANVSDFSDTLAHASGTMTQVLSKTNSAVSRLDSVMAGLERGEGSAGKLLQDESLYNSLDSTSRSLDLLLKDLRANPKRYVHFSIFGRTSKPKDDK